MFHIATTPTGSLGLLQVESEADVVEYLNGLISAKHRESAAMHVLDAGCGERCALEFGPNAIVTGVDISHALLARNQRLDTRIVADLAHARLTDGHFDTIVCWDVLEHLENPLSALDNLARSLAPRGMLVLKAPNLHSPKGLVTKYTPYRFHRWVYRRFDASDGAMPFPTRFDRSVAAGALHAWAQAHGLSLRTSAYWEADLQMRLRTRLRLRGQVWAVAQRLVRTLSFGAVDARATDFVLVFEKP
jgi:SAM-dependent methyltransferase